MWPFRSRLLPPPVPRNRAISCGRPSKVSPGSTSGLPARASASGSNRSISAPAARNRSARYSCRRASSRGGSSGLRAVVSKAISSVASATSSSRRLSISSVSSRSRALSAMPNLDRSVRTRATANTRRAASVPSRIASSSDLGERQSPASSTARPAAASSGPRRSSGTRPRASTSRSAGSAVSSSGAKTLRNRASPPDARRELEVVEHGHARAVQPLEVEVAPVLVEGLADRDRGDGERHVPARGAQHLGGVETRGISAPVGDDDTPTLRQRSGEHVPGLDDRNALEREVRQVRPRARRDDDGIRLERRDAFRAGLRAQADVEAAVVLQQPPRDLGAARSRERHLAAGPAASLEHDGLVARPGRLGRRGEPGRSRSDDDEAPAPRRRRGPRQGALASGAGVHRADDRSAGVVVGDADVAADAADDLVGSTGRGLRRPGRGR